jgi:predicted HTH domain antitoxin
MAETMTFEVSQDLLASLKIGNQNLTQEIRLMVAITWFQEKKLSLGIAADLAGCNRLSFMDILRKKGLSFLIMTSPLLTVSYVELKCMTLIELELNDPRRT